NSLIASPIKESSPLMPIFEAESIHKVALCQLFIAQSADLQNLLTPRISGLELFEPSSKRLCAAALSANRSGKNKELIIRCEPKSLRMLFPTHSFISSLARAESDRIVASALRTQ